jgi:hypothetical protein
MFRSGSVEGQASDSNERYLLHIEQKSDLNLEDVKFQLQELFNSLSNVIHRQNNRIIELESKVTYLLTKSKIDEKKIIADILTPL